MTIINATTKRGQSMIAGAMTNLGSELSDVYGKYSARKGSAMAECKRKCRNEHGKNFRIISRNCDAFSVAWDIKSGLRIETAYNSYLIQ